jgi:hypothetical protein
MTDINQLTEVLSAQLTTVVQAPLIEIAACFQEGQDDDGDYSWNPDNIVEAIYPILARLGVIKRCEECNYDFAWANTTPPETGDCPNWDSHSCSGGCGNTNDECSCDCCDVCGYYDCECPQCENCEERTRDCTCTEAEKMWPADA